jgi:hypothetical protein
MFLKMLTINRIQMVPFSKDFLSLENLCLIAVYIFQHSEKIYTYVSLKQ